MSESLADDLRPEKFSSLLQLIDYFRRQHAELPASSCFGRTLRYRDIERLRNRFAYHLLNKTNLRPGDRIAIQLPKVLQFPVAVYGALK